MEHKEERFILEDDMTLREGRSSIPEPTERKKAELYFGPQLEEAVSGIEDNLIIYGPSYSGKTTFAAAVATLGFAALGKETGPLDLNLTPDFAPTGYDIDEISFFSQITDDIDYKLEEYKRAYGVLPPIIMFDELTPTYLPYIERTIKILEKKYSQSSYQPKFIYVLQGEVVESMEQIQKYPTLFGKAHKIELAKKPVNRDINNAHFRSAASNTLKLEESIGKDRFNRLLNAVSASLRIGARDSA